MRKPRTKRGSTLIEIMMYFSLLSLVLGAVMSFALQVMDMSKKSDNLHETQANLAFITRSIVSALQTAESADSVNSVFDDDNGKLVLFVPDAYRSPTQYYLEEGDLYVKYGTDVPVRLNSDNIACTKLNFSRLTLPKVPDLIGIDARFETGDNEMAGLDTLLQINTSVSLRI